MTAEDRHTRSGVQGGSLLALRAGLLQGDTCLLWQSHLSWVQVDLSSAEK